MKLKYEYVDVGNGRWVQHCILIIQYLESNDGLLDLDWYAGHFKECGICGRIIRDVFLSVHAELTNWPERLLLNVYGYRDSFWILGAGQYPEDCPEKKEFPNAIIYENSTGRWVGSYDIAEYSPGKYRYIGG